MEKIHGDDSEFARHSSEQIEQLAQDIAENGQLQSVAVTEDGELVFGHGRFLAVKKLGWKFIRARIFTKGLTKLQFRLIRASENIQRTELTPHRKWILCVELMAANGWDQQTLAAHLHLTPAAVSKLLSASKTTAAWQKALEEGKVTLSDCEIAARLPSDQQDGLLALKLSGAPMNRDQLKAASRKVTTPKAETVKQARIPFRMSTGTTVVVCGPEMDLEAYVETLLAAVEAARKSIKEKLDIRTAIKVWADKAKAV